MIQGTEHPTYAVVLAISFAGGAMFVIPWFDPRPAGKFGLGTDADAEPAVPGWRLAVDWLMA